MSAAPSPSTQPGPYTQPSHPSGRPTIVAGNWKMNLVRREVLAFAEDLVDHFKGAPSDAKAPSVFLFPSNPFLITLSDRLRHTPVVVGAQDLHPADSGAHTGDTSAKQLRSAGASWVLCGHSERRHDHGEGNDLVAAKTQATLDGALRPMVCVGETLDEREAGRTEEVLAEQLNAVLNTCSTLCSASPPQGTSSDNSPFWALAYEPVWAIGTGKTATPEIAQEAHVFLRSKLRERIGEGADSLPILYGGSAKPANCQSLLEQPDVDGLLIGGASLDSASFLDMIRRCG